MSEFRFAAVISHPIQHYSPIFRQLATVPGVQVRVFYLCDHGVRESYDAGFGASFAWDVPLTEGHDHEFLRPGFSPERFGFLETDSPEVEARLDEFRPHAIWVHGYGQRISWRAVAWARNRAAVLYFGDSELLRYRSIKAKVFKKLVLPRFFGRCDAFITVGDNNESYYRHYRVPDNKFFRGACPIDVPRFAAATRMSAEERLEVRARYGLPDEAFVLIFSGKFQDYKRPQDVVMALKPLMSYEPPVHALLIGDGPMRAELERLADRLGVGERTHITGFVNQAEIPRLVAVGDAVVLSSEQDAHPLAVSEALPAGLPVIATDRVGCVGPTDTARPGENALVYPCGDVDALVKAVEKLVSDGALYLRMSKVSRELAPTQDVGYAVDAVLRALLSLRGRFRAQWKDVRDEVFLDWEASISGRKSSAIDELPSSADWGSRAR